MRFFSLFIFVFVVHSAFAALQFPALTGRVVDDAHILSSSAQQNLTQMLENYEQASSNQIAVVTVPTLQGVSIEEYGYQLGRTWQIGEQGKNNGALLIIAPNEKKVRIEVGYGLEPILTDALSSKIINAIIIPAFQTGNMEQGIIDGTQAILAVLGGKDIITPPTPKTNELSGFDIALFFLFLLGFILFARRNPFLALALLSGGISRFGGRGRNFGSSGGIFRGRGGSFGGGGASGSW
ncbi:MAG: TPM domain-containing protein [Alphaproteobacteria bacterium]|nr:TPM domain-containing protein [Alphaproteobacteria bacterium]